MHQVALHSSELPQISSVLHSRLFFPTCHEMRRKGKYQEQRYDDDEETDHEAETVSLEH